MHETRLRRLILSRLALVAASAAAFGCSDTGPIELARSDEPIQTDSLHYQLAFDGIGYHVKIPYIFTNRTGGTVYIVNCDGFFDLHLEHDDDTRSPAHSAWAPVLDECLSAPIVIENDATFTDTLDLWGAAPGQNVDPEFDRADPSGIYRIVWDDALSSYQDQLPFGSPIARDARISNRFTLTR